MNDKNRNKTFHRVRQRIPYLGVGGMAIFMFYSALESFTEGFTTLRLSAYFFNFYEFFGFFVRLFFLILVYYL